MYTSNYSASKRHDNGEYEQNLGKRHGANQDQHGEGRKKCPSCGRDLVLLLEKFGEICEPKGPGPPDYKTSANQDYSLQPDSYYPQHRHTSDQHYYNNKTKGQYIDNGKAHFNSTQLNYQHQSLHSNSYHKSNSGYNQTESYGDYYDPAGVSRDNYNNQSNQYHTSSSPHGNYHYNQQPSGNQYSQTSHDYRHQPQDYNNQGYITSNNSSSKQFNKDGYQQTNDVLSGGWYCSYCGLHILPDDRIMDTKVTSSEKPDDPPMETDHHQQLSPDDMDTNKSIDEEYKMWEIQVNKDFSNFLIHIKEYFSEKEIKLKEYQIDLCQREKSLQSNESYFKQRMDTLKKAEDAFQDKVERLNLQVQDRMQRLREYEGRITRLSNNHKNKYKEASTQTSSAMYSDTYHRGYHQPQRYPTNERTTMSRDRLSRDPRMSHDQKSGDYVPMRRSYENDPSKMNGVVENPGDSDYMFMGEVRKTSPQEIAGSPYYIDIQHLSQKSQLAPQQQPNQQDREIYVDTSHSNNAGDSGFNTPDADFNQASYSEAELPLTKPLHMSRPRDVKPKGSNSSNNSNNNIPLESQSVNSSSSHNSNSSINYNGERAVLVKSPNGVEAYRAQTFKNTAVHRSSSVPQNRAADRSPSAERDRAQSMPPDPDLINDSHPENTMQQRPKSDYYLDKPDILDDQLSSDSQRVRSGSFGSNTEQGQSSRRVTSPGPKPMTPTKSRLPRDRKPKHPDPPNEKDSSSDSNKSNSLTKEKGGIGLRSRSSESVQRGYRHNRQGKFHESRKKAQSDLNLSSENWAEDQDDDVAIYHRKSTSFDSPRSYGYKKHVFQSNSLVSNAKNTVKDTQSNDVTRSDGFVHHGKQLTKDTSSDPAQTEQTSAYINNDGHNKVQMEKPRVRGRRSDMSMPHRKLNRMEYHTASGSYLNPHQSSYGIVVRAIPNEGNGQNVGNQRNIIPENNTHENGYSAVSNHENTSNVNKSSINTRQFSVNPQVTYVANRYPNDGSDVIPTRNNHVQSYSKPGYNYPDSEQYLPRNVPPVDKKNGLFIDVSNEGGTESPEMTSTPRDYVPSLNEAPQDNNNLQSNNLSNKKQYQNDNDYHSYSNVTQYKPVHRDNVQSDYPHRYGHTEKPPSVNSQHHLSDKSTWSLKQRRENTKHVTIQDSNNNYGQKKLSRPTAYRNVGDLPSPTYTGSGGNSNSYGNVYQANSSSNTRLDTVTDQRNRNIDYRDSSNQRQRPDHYEQKNASLDQRPSRYDQRNTDLIRGGKTISYVPPQEHVPRSDLNGQSQNGQYARDVVYDNEGNMEPEKPNRGLEEVFVTNNNNGKNSTGKKKYFGFSPRYKEILSKYGGGSGSSKSAERTEKGTTKKKEKEVPSPIVITSGTTRFGFKKQGGEKENSHHGSSGGKGKKDKDKERSRPTSPRSKLPHYNNYIKEITTH